MADAQTPIAAYQQKIIENYPTMRDNFAGSALTGCLANPNVGTNFSHEHLARLSYEIADAMLKERAK